MSDPTYSTIPPAPSPWPVGSRQPAAPGVGDFLCQMVRELRSLRNESGIPRGMRWQTTRLNLGGTNPQQIVGYNPQRRYLQIGTNATNCFLSLDGNSTTPTGIVKISPSTPYIVTWQQQGEMVCQAVFTPNGTNLETLEILEGIATSV